METTDQEVADALLGVGRALMGITLRSVAAAPVPMTVPQHRVLLLISTDGPRRVGILAADLGVNQSSASRLVDRLVAQGLVQRMADPADGRASLVALSARGEKALAAVHERRLAAVLDVVAVMPTRARREVLAFLAEAAAAMEVEEAVCVP
ncbi:hypothetical protein ASG76_06285 [Nocardioides sp. Soil774]|uniref:MarR family winged helix-turn-helix transcriptional regulator n=1 Tax=Nocardioides sp. Soil774 TaxID=1736408 RepID=UPI0007011D4F|nr:MarR family transcriptional regulator [Nocardioides sp. Soil774]KRE95270.1 hypothetical protein ASG76_06285 [Nocardioides sp. Soil774]